MPVTSPIRCPGCGREYAGERFAMGRTLDCTCGTRVGADAGAPLAWLGRDEELCFMVDAMLGRLARWLRLVGFDAAYESGIADADLARRAHQEGRIVLTRDRALLEEWRLPRAHYVLADSPLEQLREVVEAFDLEWRSRLFSRCGGCGSLLEPVAAEAVAGDVPARILEEQSRFRRCVPCGKVYWGGSHTDRMRRALEDALSSTASCSRPASCAMPSSSS